MVQTTIYKLPIVLFMLLICLPFFQTTEYCGHELRGNKGKIKYNVTQEEPSYFFAKKENLEINCLYYKRMDRKFVTPAFLTIAFTNLSVHNEAIEVRGKSQRHHSRWKTLNTFSNIHSPSYVDVLIDAIHYPIVKLVVPKSLLKPESVHIDYSEGKPITLINGTHLYHPNLRFCGYNDNLIDVDNCSMNNENIHCVFSCKNGYLPLYINPRSYPRFEGFCRYRTSSLWPNRHNQMCVSQKKVDHCMESGNCNFKEEAFLWWYEQNGDSEAENEIINAIIQTENENYDIMSQLKKYDCTHECDGKIADSGEWEYVPNCTERANIPQCMVCRYPRRTSRCFKQSVVSG